jgi:hypothetical protein
MIQFTAVKSLLYVSKIKNFAGATECSLIYSMLYSQEAICLEEKYVMPPILEHIQTYSTLKVEHAIFWINVTLVTD